MKFFDEFKTFIARGNVMDMAVGVVIANSFKAIVDSLVADIVMPFVGMLTNRVNIAGLSWKISDKLAITYGNFLQTILNFIITAFAIFCAVKLINTFKERMVKKQEEIEEEAKEEPSKEEILLTEIRDLLKKQ